MSTEKQHILSLKPNDSEKRKELLNKLGDAIEDNGNTNVLLVHAIAQHVGLSAAEFECAGLIQQGPFTAGELAKRCHITTGGMTGMIDRLEKRGFVKREADPNDRRRVLVRAVENKEARRKVQKLYSPLQISFNELIATYSEAELEFILDFMTRTNNMFHAAVDALPDKP
jgi:DNA-binding MarR family transcriptional regulator